MNGFSSPPIQHGGNKVHWEPLLPKGPGLREFFGARNIVAKGSSTESSALVLEKAWQPRIFGCFFVLMLVSTGVLLLLTPFFFTDYWHYVLIIGYGCAGIIVFWMGPIVFGTSTFTHIFDKQRKHFFLRRSNPFFIYLRPSAPDLVSFTAINSNQLLTGKNKGNTWYEINLVLNDFSRRNILVRNDFSKARIDARRVADFLSIPVIDSKLLQTFSN